MAIIYSGGFSHSAGRRAAPLSECKSLKFFCSLFNYFFTAFDLQSLWIFSITAKNNQPGSMRRNASGNFFFLSAVGENIALFNGPARSTDVHLSQNVLSVIESYLHASG
jgi:hypothetical protein